MTLRRKFLVVDLGLFVVLLVIVAVMALDGETLAAVTTFGAGVGGYWHGFPTGST
jgi:hypothetical protein